MREVALIIFLAAFGVGLIVASWLFLRQPAKRLSAEMDDGAFIKWLARFERWYTRSSVWSHRVLVLCRITPIIIGFVIAVVSALKDDNWTIMGMSFQRNIVVIVLTAISTVCVAILTQVGVTELARAREVGRINCAALVARAKIFFSIERTPEEAYAEKVRIKDEIFKIELDQHRLFAELAAENKQLENQAPPQASQQPQDRTAGAGAAQPAGAVRDAVAPDRAARLGALVGRLSKNDPPLAGPERELELASAPPQPQPSGG